MNKSRVGRTLVMALLSEIANKLVPLVNLHLVATRLGTEEFGRSQYALWILEWGILATMFGFSQIAPVLYQSVTTAKEKSQSIGAVISCKLALACVSTVVLLVILSLSSDQGAYSSLVLPSVFIFFTSALDGTWILLATQRMAVFSAVSILAKLASVLAISLLVRDPSDSSLYVAISCGANGMISLASMCLAFNVLPPSLPLLRDLKNVFFRASPYASALICFMALDRFDLYLVEKYLTHGDVGLFAAASKLVASLIPVIVSITNVFYSEMIGAKNLEDQSQYLKSSLFWVSSIFLPLAIGLAVLSRPTLKLIFGESFEGASSQLSVLVLGAGAYGVIHVFGFQLLILKNLWRPLIRSLVMGSLIGFGLGVWLVPKYGLDAAAWVSVCGRWIAGCFVLKVALNVYQRSIRDLFFSPLMMRTMIPGVIMGVGLIFLKGQWILGFSSQVVLGAVLYLCSYLTLNWKTIKPIVLKKTVTPQPSGGNRDSSLRSE